MEKCKVRFEKMYKITNMIRIIALAMSLIIGINFWVCYYGFYTLSKEFIKYAERDLIAYTNQLEQQLNSIANIMGTQIIHDTNIKELQDIETTEENEFRQLELVDKIKKMLVTLGQESMMSINYIIYFEDKPIQINSCNTSEQYIAWRGIENELRDTVVNNLAYTRKSAVGDWNITTLNDKNYIIKYYHYEKRYICSWMSIDQLLGSYQQLIPDQDYYFVFSDEVGEPYNAYTQLEDYEVVLKPYDDQKNKIPFFFDYMTISKPVKRTSFYLNVIITGDSLHFKTLNIQLMVVILMLIGSGLSLIGVWYVRVKPLCYRQKNEI